MRVSMFRWYDVIGQSQAKAFALVAGLPKWFGIVDVKGGPDDLTKKGDVLELVNPFG